MEHKAHGASRMIIVLGLLSAFAPFSTDMYLPAFDLIAKDFAVSHGSVELTLSVFFLGLCVGQAVYGPLSDRIGRRAPLILGVLIYIVSTISCLLAPNIELFTAARFLQAIGGSAGMIVGRAVINDLFDERESARALSSLMAVITLAPIVAPILGGLIISFAGWQAVFLFMLLFGLCCLALVWFTIPETLSHDKKQVRSLLEIGKIWGSLLCHRVFLVPAVVGGLAQACMFSFITGSPFVFINLHGASSRTYGFLFAAIACALIIGANINRLILRKHAPERILNYVLFGTSVAGILTVLSVPSGNLVMLMIPLWCTIGSLGFIGADAAAVAMEANQGHPGSASSLIGIMQFGCASLVSTLVASAQNGTAYPMTVSVALCGTAALIVWTVFWRFLPNRTEA